MAKLSELVAKARRDPYPLELDDGTTVSIAQPTVPQWRQACEADDITGFLTVLNVSADDAARVSAELDGAVFGAESAVVTALRGYFGQGN